MKEYLYLAAKIAQPSNENERRRNFYLGAIGIRRDGVIVSAKNGATGDSTPVEIKRYILIPSSHAECRVLMKLGKGGTLFVSRVSKKNGSLVMSRPCRMCQIKIKSLSVKKVYYTINNNYYGVWYPITNEDKVFRF